MLVTRLEGGEKEYPDLVEAPINSLHGTRDFIGMRYPEGCMVMMESQRYHFEGKTPKLQAK